MLKQIGKVLTTSLIAIIGCTAVHAAETRGIVESFSCNYLAGKDQRDLDKAVKFWQQSVDKINSPTLNSYFATVLQPIRSTTDFDFFWLGANPNLNSWAKSSSDYVNSKEGQAADARFAKMSKCTSNMYFSEPLHVGLTPSGDADGAVMIAAGCTLKKGKTMRDVMAAEAPRIKQSKAANTASSIYRLTPYIANTPIDVVYLIVYQDLESLGKIGTMQLTSKDWMATGGKFAETMECNSGLYSTNIVHMPPNPS